MSNLVSYQKNCSKCGGLKPQCDFYTHKETRDGLRPMCRNYRALRKNKAGRKWESLIGYTVADLKKHIEKQFKKGMTWERFMNGEIHIDHKIPKVAFNYKSPSDPDFHKCWALKNLQPMWAVDNLIKGKKLDKPFQPSLLIGERWELKWERINDGDRRQTRRTPEQ